ncbi:hypothetical protein [Flavobacterium lacus]|uniref:Trimeric autotransporter adhesin n=1 Tax=Flavobacterium lacus TaxID=1353778 RepID=A0A328WXC0_9FLAO|nr:hypothetical protein [Flavobacterium lacus]RAR50931.1 trimeric autotransporter adhesin [Flavobacterium lacus]
MKKILILLLLLPYLSIAQVGVNTTAPKAALDVESTNNGVLIPRVQLTSTLDITTVVNPNAGPLETSTLVYNIAPAGVVPNNVVAGFYYWNGSQWTAIAGNAPSDHDWYEVGTTVAPNAITDNMFNLGKVVIGSATPAATAVLQVELGASTTDGILFNGANNGAGTVPNLGAGTRMMFFPGKNAFRAGSVSGTQWDNSNVGANSAAMGRNNTASGYGSFAMGEGSIASGTNTVAMGNSATATGEHSVAMGNSTANASYATALNTSTANEENATSMGIATANGYGSLATGFSTTFGNYAISGGAGSVASGNNSVATGDSSIASGQNAVAMGRSASATAADSAAFGSASATGQYATAFNNSIANGQNTIAMVESTANGDSSVSTGFSTANGAYSFSGGFGTTAQSIGETTLGVFNRLYTMSPSGSTTLDGNDHLFNLGNGTSAIATHNALTVFKDGRLNINEAYTLPNTDGTANQVLQTNGTGTLSWQTPSSSNGWLLNGNAGTNPPSTIDSPVAATENFIGTTDYEDLVFGANNRSRMKISAFGNIGIGTNNPNAKFEIEDINSPYITSWLKKSNLSGSIIAGGSYVSPTLIVTTTSTGGGTNELYYNSQFTAAGFNNATNIAARFYAAGGANNYAIVVPILGGRTGLGTETPSTRLHVENATSGAVRIVDGTQAAGRVLTSDLNGVATWQNPTPSGFTHYLGELYLGGIIFELYKGSDGLEHGLIVSLTESSHAWQTTNTLVNANRSEDGAFNTAQMTSSPAASYVSSLGAGWYIPSIDELNILYNNRYYANKALRLGGYTLISRTALYWSSTEYIGNSAYSLFSFTGTFGQQDKSDTNVVRAIRAF